MVNISVKNVSKSYNDLMVLHNASLEIEGGVSLLMGKNGSGKSTLLSIIQGINKQDTGEVKIDGFSPHREPEKALRKICFLPEKPVVFGSHLVKEFIRWHCEVTGSSYKDAIEILGYFEMLNTLDMNFRNLSMGERQLVILSCVLSRNSQLYVLDEPNANVDSRGRMLIAQIISKINKRNGAGFLITSHIIDTLFQVTDRIFLLKNGKIAQQLNLLDVVTQEKSIEMTNVIYSLKPEKLLHELLRMGMRAYSNGNAIFTQEEIRSIYIKINRECTNQIIEIKKIPNVLLEETIDTE
ncbi:MAG: ABC transporter ATP-binding protein [Candidatus Thermoplasmatota archaeon]|jgi:ABC-2 type transport system ATP-binding protein|nr:ABC transporter ATP-binding protein [Candidatus Thermoplasmatota archaeon]